eukprot:TRINITY_DN83243_c0_g1_i1.p1 TRINITY_DN83243_c0_g1~~TRINITY_DN83243_c0_g1_i1.p1  ORF type:complete len:268 (-),score=46.90 TRINITY_DN83243_c0_g1_i1:162-965(-)
MSADRRALGSLAAVLSLTMMSGGAISASQAFLAGRQAPNPAVLSSTSLSPPRGLSYTKSTRTTAGAMDESVFAEGQPRSGLLAFGASLLALTVAVTSSRESRVTCFFRKRYGGGHVKADPAAIPEYGPQYVGPKLKFQIQRDSRLGFPKNGEERVIPRLAGGSYDRRKAMMRNLTTELIRHGRIKTTRARAQALQSFANRMVILARRGDDLSMREAQEWMYDEKLVDNLFELAKDRYPDLKQKNFVRLTPTMNRKGDWADMSYIELV